MVKPGASRRATLAALALPFAARAQAPYPDHQVRIVVPYAPGGPSDIITRLLAEGLFRRWGQPVVVENRPGAGSAIGTEIVARAAPDGHTLLLAASAHVMNPPVMARLPFDPVRDFSPIFNAAFHPMVLVVNPKLPIVDLPGFIAASKAKPGGLTMSSAGVGIASHLACALFGVYAGIVFTQVPFTGAAPAQTAVVSGQVDGGFLNSTVATPMIRSGQMRGITVAHGSRWRELPELPTTTELGFPRAQAGSWYGWLAPAGLPAPLLARLAADMAAVVAEPAVQQRILAAGLDPMAEGPPAFAARIAREATLWREVVRAAGIRQE
jgi:tripartite-type tricarboxylate transporter receptor subunit TctC